MQRYARISYCLLALVQPILASPASAADAGRDLPARFEGDRVYVVPRTDDGRTLRLYTDTGGGLFLKQAAVERLGLTAKVPDDQALKEALGPDASVVTLPPFASDAWIPAPSGMAGELPVMPTSASGESLPGTSEDDGMLGQAWFAGRVWTWDYPAQRLRLEGDHWKPPAKVQHVRLGFRTDRQGKRETDFPRIDVRVDGRVLPLLLDTGAMTVLTGDALQALGDGQPAERATSMITDHVFRAWRAAHPDWRVIENAQAGTGSAMIEVPDVEIAGMRVGPVWFTHRPDPPFHEFMSGMMDARVEGALGGNALRHFVMTVDYPRATAYFRCAAACAKEAR